MPGRADKQPSTTAAPITVRRLDAARDSYAHLTTLFHRAYATQVAMGLRPLAGRQDEATTKRRCESGECYVAVARPDDAIVGAVLFQEVEEAEFPPFFDREGVAHFSLLAVEPALQGRGIGNLLLTALENRARELTFTHLALSMAEPDEPLRRYYDRRGYAFIEHWQWPYTNYRSLILAKPI